MLVRKLILHTIILFFCLQTVHAQAINISGTVTDEHTKEPIGFANVYVKGTTIGTATNMNGHYTIEAPENADTLVASVLGYKKQKKPIGNRAEQQINFELRRADFSISEIVVRASGENPAHVILKNVIQHKHQNNRDNLESYQYEVYNKIEVDIDNIEKASFTNKKLFKPFRFILENIDSVSDEKPFLPVFLTETLSDYYYRKKPKAQKEYIKASRLSGVKDATITDFLGSMYQNINIYKDFIPILGKSFVSPIAKQSLKYYNYYMADTAVIDGRVSFKITFEPQHKQTNTFFGYFWVVDKTFAIEEISMQMAEDVNINFVERLSVYQDFSAAKDESLPPNAQKRDSNKVWMLKKDKLVIDFISSQKAVGIPGKKAKESLGLIGRKTTSYKDIKVNNPNIDKHFDESEEVVVAKNVYEKDEKYWNKVRHDTLSKNEKAIYAMVDTLKKIPQFKTYVDVVTTIVSGYKEAGKVDIGPYFSILSTDQVEGVRIRLGVRTNSSFSERLLLKGYVAYGTKDRDYKYGLGTEFVLTREPWQKIGLSYKDDLDLESEHFNELDEDNLFAFALRKNIPQKLLRIEKKRFYYERQLNKNFSTRVTFSNTNIDPYFDFRYILNEQERETISTTEGRLNFRFAYQEKFIKGGFNRVSVGTKYPILELDYKLGVSDFLQSDFSYHKLSFSVDDNIQVKPKGTFEYYLEGGKIFNTLPYILLKVPKGNETYYYNKYAFNNMSKYRFAADEYAKVYMTHYFEGLLLDRVPLVRKLKWRTLLTARAFWGRMNEANEQFNAELPVVEPYPTPYVEVGGGIENIFKLFRIDAVWRLTKLGLPDSELNRFNVYGSLQLKF